MPGRLVPLVEGQIYHIINRGAARRPTFSDSKSYQRAIDTLSYYQNANPPLSYASFNRLSKDRKNEIAAGFLNKKDWLVEILAYCFMPNHIHLLLKQKALDGISKFMDRYCNSHVRYFNIRKEILGPLFESRFKAVRIETDEQLLHVCRYIHLNPYSAFVVKKFENLEAYPYSSIQEYLDPKQKGICSKEEVLSFFKKPGTYRQFLFDQADYQRHLQEIKHLTMEEFRKYPAVH